MRRSGFVLMGLKNLNYFAPLIPFPEEYAQRIANKKQVVLTDLKDPKNKWGTRNFDHGAVHPSYFSLERHNFGGYETRAGPVCDIPPVPVYRSKIFCRGHMMMKCFHPVIFIKCPPNKVVTCKWCRTKFINMATEDDNDDDWEEEAFDIMRTPEKPEDAFRPFRGIDGVLRPTFGPEGPHPHVFRSVFDPEKYKFSLKQSTCSHEALPEGKSHQKEGESSH